MSGTMRRRTVTGAAAAAAALNVVGAAAGRSPAAARPSRRGEHTTVRELSVAKALASAWAQTLAEIPGQGVQAVLLRRGRLLWSAHHGMAVGNVHPALPVDDNTLFNYGSFGKMILGAFALHEAEKGTVDLDAPISRYVGDTVAGSRQVTPRMLLAQITGYGNVYADPDVVPLFPPGTEGAPPGTGPSRYRPDAPFTFAQLNAGIHAPDRPGARYEYQNTNFIILLQVLVKTLGGEARTQAEIARFLARAGSVAPQNGRRITQDRSARHTLQHFAHGYHPLPDGLGLQDYNTAYGATGVPTDSFGFPFGDGLFAGTALGAAQFLDALFSRNKLLGHATVEAMTEPSKQARAAGATYGLATESTVVDGVTWQGHPGTFGGFTSSAYTDIPRQATLVVLTNRDRPAPVVSDEIWAALATAYAAALK
ncbi:beta-lactamase family protein [Streptomyces sp. SID14478]|uniref:serine hydrolase domain-containing protein n=1 Tax=Streptomyces sp. SID14478 TaxID=2706073 RepID=UPI0013DAB52C|nr:serine hydrolase domain-containing protein [Streptomyces sp. SID14478]NEB78342.1 beta-lactamase family protein [Streptomyces sp. SID14478]